MGLVTALRKLFGGRGPAKPISIRKALRTRSASDRALLAVRATGRAAPGLLTERLSPQRLRFSIGSLIAVRANLHAPDDQAIYRLTYDLHKKHWDSDHDESGSVETALAFLTSISVNQKSPPDPAREAIDFATIGLVEHLVKRESAEPDWSRIKYFEPIVEAPLRADIAREGALDAGALWTNDTLPEGLDADWGRLLAALDDLPSWVAWLNALRSGQTLTSENDRLALDSLSKLLDDQTAGSTS